jgi:hypothetical protein
MPCTVPGRWFVSVRPNLLILREKGGESPTPANLLKRIYQDTAHPSFSSWPMEKLWKKRGRSVNTVKNILTNKSFQLRHYFTLGFSKSVRVYNFFKKNNLGAKMI